MLGFNGGLIGKDQTTSRTISVPGVWTLQEQMEAVRNNLWPSDPIVTNGLVLNLDAGQQDSYPGSGTTWTDLSGNGNNGTLVNGVGYNSGNGGYLVFDGSNDYVNSTSISSQFTSDITVEAWVYLSSYPGDWVRIIGTGGNSGVFGGNRTFGLWYNGPFSGRILWQRYGAGDPSIFPVSPTLSIGTWHHIVATTSGSSHVLYLNASSIGTATAAGPWAASGENITIGFAGFHAYHNGRMSNLRLYNRALSAAEIQQNYNALKSRYPGGDPDYDKVSLLLRMNGSNGSTTFTDGSINNFTVTVFGNAQVTTTDPKFGTGSLTLDGSGDYLTLPANAAFQFGTGDFTVECWVYVNSGNSNKGLFTFGTTNSGLAVLIYLNQWYLTTAGGGGTPMGGATTDTWQHLAVTRSGSSLRMFINGIQLGSTLSNSTNLSDNALKIGYYYTPTLGGFAFTIDARIDDFRVTKGLARYTSDFTPPGPL